MSIKSRLRRLAERSYWLQSTETKLAKAAEDLVAKGLSEDEACEFVNRMWEIASAEYGE